MSRCAPLSLRCARGATIRYAASPAAILGALLLAGEPASIAQAQSPVPPPSVTVATVEVRDVAPSQTFIGRVTPIEAVQIVARVTAFIDDVPVKQGSDVKSGQVIYQLQNAQYAAAVEAAQTQLASANAALKLAQVSLDRASHLLQRDVAAQATLDQAQATRDQSQANVQAAQANLVQAQLNLSYCTIASPIDGRIGAVTLTKGNLVTPSTPPLATINQLDPIRVVFSVANELIMTAEQRQGRNAAAIAKGLTLHIVLPDGSEYGEVGQISFLSNQVDPRTGTVNVYADFPNPNALLIPGAFVTIQVRRAVPQERPLIPIQAVQTDQSGSYVLTVGADNKVAQQRVSLGRQIGQNFIVQSGVSGGERVIIEGIQKVHPGEVVSPTPAPPPPTSDQGGATNSAGTNGPSR
jgi:membrane fusion protein, multidrug efflux system